MVPDNAPESVDSDLLFRRQFVLSDRAITQLAHWNSRIVGDGLHLYVHPDLTCTHVRANNTEAICLGFLTDADNPQYDDGDILQNVIDDVRSADELLERLDGIGGRWVLVVVIQGRTLLVTDPAGLRQVFYTRLGVAARICASQPGIIAEVLGLQPDARAMSEFVQSDMTSDREYWWPGDECLYREIRHLLPNHYLDFTSRESRRFWPVGPIEDVPFRVAVREASQILKGQWAAVSSRFSLAQSITAGVDSRTVLAAGRDVAPDVLFYTMIYYNLTEQSPDVRIPARLLRRLNLRHDIYQTPDSMRPEFADVYRKNVTNAHECWGNIIQGLYDRYPQDRVAVDGAVSEIARCYYYTSGQHPAGPLDGRELAGLAKMSPTPFVLNAMERWLADARPAADNATLPLLDLFYWEQRVGNWASMALSELDVVQETFTLFNHRRLLQLLLGVPARNRCRPYYRLYRAIIRELWPEALAEPINPEPARVRAKNMVLGALNRMHLDKAARLVYHDLLELLGQELPPFL